MKFYDWFRQAIRNPKYRWWIIGGSVVYLISPFDIAPDFIPFIGQLDDALIMTLVISEVSQILLERIKLNKDRKSAEAVNSAPSSTVEANPVDVKAVNVE
ncbi:MAG: DUF1232 domain-containing protein [Leptolyngbyaceae cyanobacterium CRU_2_3]|nr:DUF1232 domain-containing protein [Leptolyngbyaceae cyanobacterium CRU_2_3]